MSEIIPLSELRKQIDDIDRQLLALINDRAKCAMEVAKTKMAEGETGSFYRPDREATILRRVMEENPGPLSDQTAAYFFRELMSSCLALEKPLEVAFFGPAGTFTQQAAYKHFGSAIQCVPVSTIDEVFTEVENKHCQFGVVPVENSTEGVITHTLDRFIASSLQICGEVEIRVHQNLMGHVETLSEITEVLSHQQSLAQCRKWLDIHLPNAARTAVSSNAEAAKIAAKDHSKMAIAGEVAASIYDLNILEKNIEDESNNTTRFMIIGEQQPEATGKDKTSLLLSTGNRAGSLHKILKPFAKYDISLSYIESRPSKQGLWDYVFFIDANGHKDDVNITQALAELSNHVDLLKILGSYPKAVL